MKPNIESPEIILEQIVEAIDGAVFLQSIDGTVQICNQEFSELVALPKNKIIGKNIAEITEDFKSHLLYSPDKANSEFKADIAGHVYWFRGTFKKVNESLLMTTLNKIEDPIRSDELLDKARKNEFEKQIEFQNLIETMSEGLIVHGPDGKVERFNPAALQILNLEKNEIQGVAALRNRWQTVREDGSPFPTESFPALLALKTGQAIRGAIMGIKINDLHTRWISINANPFETSAGRCVNVTFTDITSVVQKNKQNKFLLESLKIGTWDLNPKSYELYWDESMYKLFEVENSEPHSHYLAWETSLSDCDKKRIISELDLALSGEKELNSTFEINTKNGKKKILGCRGTVVRSSSGEPIQMIGINWDMTEEYELKKKLEEEKAKSVHSAKLASLGEMAAEIAHEINNPLSIIAGYAVQLKKFRSDEVKFDAKIDSINSAIKRIVKIINGLRKFSRSSDGREYEIHSIANVIREALIINNSKAKNNYVNILLDLDENAFIKCDSIEIEQVIVNLVNNSIDAIKDLPERWVKISVQSNKNKEIVLKVIDSGPGIKPQIEAKLFQPFYTTKPAGQGTGLGLSISKSILEHHQAKIRLNRDVSNTCFEVTFPSQDKMATTDALAKDLI